MVVLDTSIIIDYLLGNSKIVALVEEILTKEDVKTTAITEYELLRYKDRIKKQAAERFLSNAVVYPFDRVAAKEASDLFLDLQANGRMVNENDLLIEAIALAHNEVMLTRDKKLANIGKDNVRTV